jgi:hypothetical protein
MYKQADDKDRGRAEAGILALKNVWLDKVDLPQRGRGSIHQMTYEMGFTTLRDAFFAARNVDDVDKMDLGDRVKRALKPRLAEFYEWKSRSGVELKKRYEIEKAYLKSETAALKLYTRWAKPYLRIAEELGMRAGKPKTPDIVNTFNTMILELKLFAKKEMKVKGFIEEHKLPKTFEKTKFRRSYFSCILVDFKFRGLPFRTPQGHYIFGGKAEISMKAFALNSDELKLLDKALNEDDLAAALGLVEEATDKSLKEMQEDLDHFLKDEDEANKQGGAGNKKQAKKSEPKKEPEYTLETLPKDNYEESILRKLTEREVSNACFSLYDVFKKSRGWASYTAPDFDTQEFQKVIESPRWKG